jgi:hypothetical protein
MCGAKRASRAASSRHSTAAKSESMAARSVERLAARVQNTKAFCGDGVGTHRHRRRRDYRKVERPSADSHLAGGQHMELPAFLGSFTTAYDDSCAGGRT